MNQKRNHALISATDVVKLFGITYQTVNHYTNLGLLDVVRKQGNARMYNRAAVKKRLNKIAQLVSEGYSLRLIRKKLTGV